MLQTYPNLTADSGPHEGGAAPSPSPWPAGPLASLPADPSLLLALADPATDIDALAASRSLTRLDLAHLLALPEVRPHLAVLREFAAFRREIETDAITLVVARMLLEIARSTEDLVERRRAACAVLRAIRTPCPPSRARRHDPSGRSGPLTRSAGSLADPDVHAWAQDHPRSSSAPPSAALPRTPRERDGVSASPSRAPRERAPAPAPSPATSSAPAAVIPPSHPPPGALAIPAPVVASSSSLRPLRPSRVPSTRAAQLVQSAGAPRTRSSIGAVFHDSS